MKIQSCLMMLAVAYATVGSIVLPPDRAQAGSFEISAWAFGRGNAQVYPNPDKHADAGLWNRSYENLLDKRLISNLNGGYGGAHVQDTPPLSFGSHRSKLVERIRQDPCKANLTREEFIKVVTWIDANAPYYGTHEGKKNLKWKDEPDFRPLPLAVSE